MIKQKTPSIQLLALSEEIGSFIEYWGFKKIHGMIWTHLYLSPVPLSALELIQKLRVSKALVSISIKDLVKYQLIIQTTESEGKKNKFYVANPDVFQAIRNVLMNRETRIMDRIKAEFIQMNEMRKSKPDSLKSIVDGGKLDQLDEMIQGADSMLKGVSSIQDIDSDVLRMMFSIRS
jgi:DNA-binding transcriptional regulator GbsR (MarR family)